MEFYDTIKDLNWEEVTKSIYAKKERMARLRRFKGWRTFNGCAVSRYAVSGFMFEWLKPFLCLRRFWISRFYGFAVSEFLG